MGIWIVLFFFTLTDNATINISYISLDDCKQAFLLNIHLGEEFVGKNYWSFYNYFTST